MTPRKTHTETSTKHEHALMKEINTLFRKITIMLPALPRYLNFKIPTNDKTTVEIITKKPLRFNVFLSYTPVGRKYTISILHKTNLYVKTITIDFFLGYSNVSMFLWNRRYIHCFYQGDHAFYTLFMPRNLNILERFGYTVKTDNPKVAHTIKTFIDTAINIAPDVIRKLPINKIKNLLDIKFPTKEVIIENIYLKPKEQKPNGATLYMENNKLIIHVYTNIDTKLVIDEQRNTDLLNKLDNTGKEIVTNIPTYLEKHVIPYIREYLIGYAIAQVVARIIKL